MAIVPITRQKNLNTAGDGPAARLLGFDEAGRAVTCAVSEFAPSSSGAKAETALQPAEIAADLTREQVNLRLFNILKSPFRPENYGARPGDIAFDSAAAIQAAINDAASSRGGWGEIKFESEDYVCNAPLLVRNNFISLIGGSRDATTIRRNAGVGDFPGDGDQLLVEAADPATGAVSIQLFNLRFRNYDPNVTKGAGIRLRHVLASVVDNVSVIGFYGGILVQGGIGNMFSNGYVYAGSYSWPSLKAGSYLFKVEPGPRTGQETPGEFFMDNWNLRDGGLGHLVDYGLVVRAVDGFQINNVHIFRAATTQMLVQPVSNSQITDILATGCYFDGDGDTGFRIVGSSTAAFGKIAISGSKFLNSVQNAFRIEAGCNVQGVSLAGNIIIRSGSSNVNLQGGRNISLMGNLNAGADKGGGTLGALVRIGAGARDVRVSDKLGGSVQGVANTATRGIWVESGATEVDVSGTSFTDVPTPIYDQSAGSAFSTPIRTSGEVDRTAMSVVGASLQWPGVSGETYIVPAAVTAFSNLIFRIQGTELTLLFTAACTVTHANNQLELAGSVSFVAKAKDTITLRYVGGMWHEVSRKVA